MLKAGRSAQYETGLFYGNRESRRTAQYETGLFYGAGSIA
jgi:hypothetical protein